MITPARKFWEIRRREDAGEPQVRIALAMCLMYAADAIKSAADSAFKRLGTNGMFALLLIGWGALATSAIAFLATH